MPIFRKVGDLYKNAYDKVFAIILVMIDPLSLISLHVETFYDNKEDGDLHTKAKIADATAFVYYKYPKYYLITNWHVVSGRHPQTGRALSMKAGIPNLIDVWFHSLGGGSLVWMCSTLPLRDWTTDEKLWIEHPRGKDVDVVALPLENPHFYKLYPLEPGLFDTQLEVFPSEAVSIIGYPYGLTGTGSLPIWKTGHIASDIETDYDGKPAFLIDSTVREGMSGSPVVARKKEFISQDKTILLSLEKADKFLGVFSSSITSKKYDPEIGLVWKPEVIKEIIDGKDELIKKIVKYKKIPVLY